VTPAQVFIILASRQSCIIASQLAIISRVATSVYITIAAILIGFQAWSVCLSVHHNRISCKNGWCDRDAVWVVDRVGRRNHVL